MIFQKVVVNINISFLKHKFKGQMMVSHVEMKIEKR